MTEHQPTAPDQDALDRLYAATVYDTDGDKIGPVGQVYLDDASQEPTWITVQTGLFGLKESFIPLSRATVDGSRITVDAQKDFVKNAPRVDPDGHLDAAEENELFAYYSIDAAEPQPTHALEDEPAPDPAAQARNRALDEAEVEATETQAEAAQDEPVVQLADATDDVEVAKDERATAQHLVRHDRSAQLREGTPPSTE